MKIKKRYYFLFILVCAVFCVHAAIYKGIDADGKTIYSDQPLPNGEEVDLPSLPTYTPPPSQSNSSSQAKPNQKEINYQIQILEPKAEQTFTTDIQDIHVKLATTPALQETDTVRLILNEQLYNPEKSLHFTFQQLPRGEYHLQAQVISADGKIVATSETIKFYQQRAFIKQNNNNLAPQAPTAAHN